SSICVMDSAAQLRGLPSGPILTRRSYMSLVVWKSCVAVETTGCIGMSQFEPLVDVIRPGEPRITYGNVSPEDAEAALQKTD
uniref:(2Fe-2S) ferredoxin domain-containing protein n=1 Tax=Acetomicrobium sp. S15 = DSM 107314 TaxID=2529858 RepID=UPI001E4B5F9E